jgi:regulator of cell morphogenesis and NO signaling
MTKPNQTLADMVANDPSRARTLDRLGLDYCCGGSDTLEHACARAGLDTADVVAQLDARTAFNETHNCAGMRPAELVSHLVDVHHAYLQAELPELDALAQKVADEHAGRHAELDEVRTLVAGLREDLEPHMHKEERVLFPAILQILDGPAEFPFGSIANPIKMMGTEHDRVGDILTRLRAITNHYAIPDDACASYRSLYERLAELEHDTHLHVFEENHLLFPQAATLESTTPGPTPPLSSWASG